MALMSRPEPIPVEVTVAVDAVDGAAADVEAAVDGVVDVAVLVLGAVLLEMVELIMLVPFQSMTMSATTFRT
jgi:hypothetical protein